MSIKDITGFEGYFQAICVNGHRFNFSVDYQVDQELCPYCKGHTKWWNLVDNTNRDKYGEIPEHDFVLLTPEVWETCDKCGHYHCKELATYRVPRDKGRIVKPKNIENDLTKPK